MRSKARGDFDRVRVGAFDYVLDWRDLNHDPAVDCAAVHDNGSLTITVDSTRPAQRQLELLLHEVLHSCDDQSALWGKEPEAHKYITPLGCMLAGFIRDNMPLLTDLVKRSKC